MTSNIGESMDISFVTYLIFGLIVVIYSVYQYINNKKKKEKVSQLVSPLFLMLVVLAMCVLISFTLFKLGVVK
jgi:hypothetical protein